MSLTLRLVLLCALVALLAVSVSALAAMRAVALAATERDSGVHAQNTAACHRRLEGILLAQTDAATYQARGDQLYDAVPTPAVAQAAGDLARWTRRPGVASAVLSGGHIVLRCAAGTVRSSHASADDPIKPAALLALPADGRIAGLGWFDGFPALWARQPIVRADGTGEGRGDLLLISYLTRPVIAALAIEGWTWRLLGPDEPPPEADPGSELQVVRLGAAAPGLAVLLSRQRTAEAALASRTLRAIALAGTVVGVVAVIVGVLLGIHWLRPLTELAAACRRRSHGEDAPIPDGGDLPETRVLAEDLKRLIALEQRDRERLSGELVAAVDANLRQRAWLTRLAHDVGSPVQAVAAAVRQLEERGGLLPPGELPILRAAVDQLLGRIEDAVGLAEAAVPQRTTTGPTGLAGYAEAVIGLMRLRAERRNVRLEVAAQGEARLDASLLTPVLVNLLANAIAAAPAGGTARLSGGSDAQQLWWEVADDGPGMPAEQRERIERACARGEVAPGEPGFGLGLTVAIANSARLGGRLRLLPGAGTTVRVELPAASG